MIVRKNQVRTASSYIDELRALLHDAGANLTTAADRIGHGTKASGYRAAAGLKQAGNAVSDYATDSWDYIRQRPRSSAAVGVAVLVGAVAAYILLSRRNRY